MAYNPYLTGQMAPYSSTPVPMSGYNTFPINIPPAVANPQPQLQSQSNVIWVQGEAAAKAYPVSAGNSMILLDSENDCFYIKSSDNAGMPNKLRKFEYKEIVEGQNVTETVEQRPDYVTKEEFDKVVSELRQRQHYNNRKGD